MRTGGSSIEISSRSISITSARSAGMTRRDLMKGGAGMAAALGLGWLAACGLRRRRRGALPAGGACRRSSRGSEPAAPPRGRRAEVHRHAAGHRARRRPDRPDQGRRRGGARLQARLRRHRLGDDGAEGDHAAGLVRRLLRLHVPVQPGVPVGQLPQRGDREAHQLGADVPADHPGQGRPGLDDLHLRGRRRAVPHALHRSGQDGQLAYVRRRRASWTGSSSTGSTSRPARPSATSRSTPSGRRTTSTWTRWATTPTSSRRSRTTVDWPELFNAELPGPRRAAERPGHRAPGRGLPRRRPA